jgi:autotransporter translocation and assembly factor TamB
MPFHIGGQIATADWKKYDADINASLSGKEVLVFTGNVSADDLDCSLDISDFSLSALTPFIPVLATLDGEADAKINARGPMRDPSIIGSLHLSGVTYKPPGLDKPLQDGYASISFDQGAVKIDSLSTSLNGGRITARGEIEYRDGGLTHVSLAANASKIRMQNPRQYSLLIDSAALTCIKQDNNYDVGGDIILGEGRFVANIQPRSLLPLVQKVERPPQGTSEAATRIRLNVRVRGGDKLWIDNNLARMRLQADLGFIGTAAKPNVTGRMSIDEGYILYLDRKFKIEKGAMDFVDPNRINPVIDFSASTSLKTYQTMSKTAYDITLSITGALDQASFSLVSDPVLDQPDIVALLTIGATREQLTGGNRADGDVTVSDILRDRAEALSSQRISSYFTRRVGDMLGLEDLSVEGNLFDIGGSSGPQLIASEQISDRVGITYTTAVGHLNEQSVRLDYRLNKFFSVEGQTDQRGRSGLDLKYRVRFK